MSIQNAVKNLKAGISKIEEAEHEIASLAALAEKNQLSEAELSNVDPTNATAIEAIAKRQAIASVLPHRVAATNARKDNLVNELEALAEALKQAIAEAATGEKDRLIDKYAKLLAGAVPEPADASRIASELPIVHSISFAADYGKSRWPDAQERGFGRFEEKAFEHVRELLSIADRFIQNGASFVPKAFANS